MKNKITAYLLSFFLLTLVFTVKAQDIKPSNSPVMSPQKTNVAVPAIETPEKTIPACETIEAIFDNKILMYSSTKPDQVTKYQSLWVTLSGFSQKAKILGYDTTTLNSDLTKLENLISAFDKTSSAFIKNLGGVQKYVCNANETYYVNSFKLAKDSLSKVRDSVRDLNTFYEENLKVDIMSLEKMSEKPAPKTLDVAIDAMEDTTNE